MLTSQIARLTDDVMLIIAASVFLLAVVGTYLLRSRIAAWTRSLHLGQLLIALLGPILAASLCLAILANEFEGINAALAKPLASLEDAGKVGQTIVAGVTGVLFFLPLLGLGLLWVWFGRHRQAEQRSARKEPLSR